MADQQRKVSLIFETNTNKAKSDINDLISSLQKLQAKPTSLIDPTGIREASKAALELQGHIQKAINVDTGKLDLSRFAASLSTSGKSLEQYRATLTRIGPEGTAAFRSVMSSINNAEVSTVRLTKGMKDFLVTMKNTAKWQISSSIMHGLIGGMQSAYGYAKSLDASLNNIRIVTGQTSDQMARFAVEANRAAQALSTTTTKYTDAALIFYQQGLDDKVVKERTEAVIKMANVTGEVAADVSSYMTAIWNNFDNGSKSLEYYADVITKLGAATAASSEEIAGGLEKFAAIANTIGLSYEYATSMITTIVDKTRQSEDVVGTALKTILARIQGLNLGDTLDDGTTLNKYSEALARVGVNIKDASGQIKDMDAILDSLGSKWGTLSKDTQIALAQVVGGVRQYNQVISLMDNWEAFKKNVNLAETSTGSLNEQADIYAEGWEAARDRVRAAAEGIYDALINEDVFIKLDNIFTGLLNGVSGVIKGMGGMVPILGTIGGIITQKFAKEMPVALNNMKQNLMVLSGQANKEALQTQKTNTLMAQDMVSRADDSYEASQFETIRRISSMKEKLIENQHRMNSAQIEEYQTLIQNEQAIRNIIDERAKSLALLEQEVQTMKEMLGIETAMEIDESAMDSMFRKEAEKEIAEEKTKDSYKEKENRQKFLEQRMDELGPFEAGENEEYDKLNAEYQKITAQLKEIENVQSRVFEKYAQNIQNVASEMVKFSAQQNIASKNAKDLDKFLEPQNIKSYEGNMTALKAVLENWNSVSYQSKDASKFLQEALDALGQEGAEESEVFEAVKQKIQAMAEAERQAAADAKLLADANAQELINLGANKKNVYALRTKGGHLGPQSEENLENKDPKGPKIKPRGNAEVLTQAAGTLMSTYGALNAIISASNTLMDENATAMEKAGAVMGVLTSTTFAATGVMGLYKTLKESQIVLNIKETGTKLASAAATTTEGVAYGFLTAMVKGAQAAVGSFMASNPIGWILAIVAAVVALGVAIANIDWRSDEEKYLDNLKEKSEALSKAQENLAQHISEVESAWDNYQNMVTALEECTTGTEAWNDALLKCNQSVTSLLAMAPGLAQFVQYNEDGSISLGGIGYEEYMQELNHKNAAMSSTGLILQNTIAQQELDIYGDQDTYEQINAFLQANSDIFRADGKISTGEDYSNFIREIFITFGEDLESATKFIAEIGLASTSGAKSLQNDYTDDGKISYDPRSSGETYAHYLNNEKNVIAAVADWGNDLIQWDAYEKSTQTAFTTLFNTLEEFDTLNAKLYGNEFEETVDSALKDKTKAYFTSDKDSLKSLMVETFKGEEKDYEEMSIENMQYLLAVADVSGNLELMNSIVTQINDTLSNLNSAGQSLIRTGNLVQANLSKENRLNAVAYTGKQLQNTTITNPYSGFNEDAILEIANREREKILSDFEWATANEAVSKLSANIPVLDDTYELVKYYNDYTMAGFDRIEETFNVQAITEALNSAQDKVKQLQPSTPTQPPIAPVDSRGGTEMYDARTKVAQLQTDLANANQAMLEATEREQENQDNFFNYIASWESLSALGAEKTQETNLLLMKTTADLLGIDLVPPEQFDSIETAMMNYAGVLVHHLDEINTLAISSMESLDTLSVIVDSRPNGFPFPSEAVEQNSKSATGMTPAELQSQGVFTTENINNFDPSWISNVYSEVEQLTSDLMSQLGYLEFDFDTQTEYFGKTFDSIIDLYNYLVNPDNQEGILNTIFEEFDNQIIEVLGITLEEGQTLISYMQEHGGEYGLSLEGIENGYEQREAILSRLQSSEFAESQAQKAINSFLGYNFTSPEEFFEMFNADGAFDKQIEASGKTLEELNFSDILDMLFEQQVQAYRNDVLEWNKVNSERFKSKLTVDSETGEFISPEGVKESDSDKLLRGLVDSGASTEDIGSFIDGLSSITAGLTNEAFSDISTNLIDMIDDGADASKVLEAFNLILSETYSKGSELSDTEILKIMEKADLSTAEFSDEILNLTGIVNIAIQSLEGINSSFEKLVSTLSKAEELKDLTTGSELSEEDYKDLEKYIPEEYKDLFMRSANGYTFYGTEEEGLAVEKGSREAIWAEEERNRVTAQEAGVELGFADNFNLEAEGVGDSILNWIMNSGMNSELFSTFAAAAGIGPGEMEEIRAAQSNNEFTEKDGNYSYTGENEVVSGALVELTNAIVAFVRGDFAGAGAEEAQLKMTGMQSREELDTAIASGDLDVSKLTNDQIEAVRSDLVTKEYAQVGISSDEIQEQIKYLQEFAEVSHLSQSELTELAASQVRFNRGIEKGQDSLKEWVKTLKKGETESEDFKDAQEGIVDTFGDVLDLDWKDSAIAEFAQQGDNLELMEKAVEGDAEALDELQTRVAEANFDNLIEGAEGVPSALSSTLDAIAALSSSLDFGTVDNSAAIAQLNAAYQDIYAAAIAGGASVADAMATANQMMNDVGFNPPDMEMGSETVTITGQLPAGYVYNTESNTVTDVDGNPQTIISAVSQEVPGGPYTYTMTVPKAKNSSGWTNTNKSVGGGGRRGGGGGGGGGGRRAPRAEKKKDTEKERYHSIKNVLEDLNDNFEKISKARDRAFGKSRVKLMEEEEKALQDLAAAQKLYLDEIEANLVQDRNNLGQLQAYSGVELKFDENGTLLNFEELQNAMWDKYNAQINGKGEVKNMTEEEWKKWEEEWQRQMDLLAQYEETQDLWKEEMQAYQDYINQIYDLRLEKVTYTVEVDLEASEHDLEFLQYMLDKIGDSAWDTAEAIANLSSQTEEYLGKLDENGEWDENGQAQDIQRGIAGILRNHSEPLPNADKKIGDVLDTDMSEYKEAVKKQQAALEALASGKDKGTTGKKIGSGGGGGGGGRNTDDDKKEPDASIPTAPSQTILSEEDIQGFMNGDQAAIDKVIAMGNNGEFTEAEVEALKDYHSKLLETNKSLMELRDTMHEKVLAAFQGFNEELQEGIDKIDHLAQLTQNYRNIVDIVGKENLNVSNTLMEAMGQASVEQGIDRVQASKARRDSLKQMLEDARASRAAATNDEDRERWDENIKQMEADLRDAEEDFMQSWEDALTSIQEQFELAVTNTIETFSDALAGPLAGSLDELQASFDRQNNLAERYLPDYEKIYELNKLNRDITNSIDETDNVKAKQELADLQQEINALEEEGVEVSRYQTEDLRRRYELKLAEIALEEAKNAKSQVQMARDSDGNWSYVYTADEEDVAAAEQNYEDKMFALQQANAQYINEMQNSLIQTQAEMASEIEAIMMDETLSMEEKMQKVNELKEYYAEMFQYYSDELQLVMDNNGTAFEDTTLSALTGFTDLQDYEQNFYDATEAMLTDLGEAYDNWEANTEAAMNAAGTTMDGYADTMAEQTQAIVEESQEAADAVEDLGQRAVDAFDGITDAVENWVTTYGEKVNEILSTNEKLADSFRKVLEEWSDFDGKTEETTPPTEPNDGETEPEPEDEPEEEKKPEGLGTVTIKKGYRMNIRTGPGTGHRDIGTVDARKKKKSYTYSKKDGKWVYIDALGGWMNGQYKKYTYLTPFDTGGYTGAWGSEGRVAMLHEKEIVLNKEDTSNLLTAVDMIRQVAKIIDLNAYSSAGFGSSLIGLASGSAGQFEQNVHITAEFPNATNREEIYAAFTDIVNLASQYANR